MLLGLWAWAGARGGMPPIPVEVSPAVRGPVETVLPTVGTVQPLREVQVGSKIAERVAKLLVEEGDPVRGPEEGRPGQVICQLDVTNTKLQIQEAKARLAEARATLAKLRAGLRANEIRQAEAEVEEQQARAKKLEQDARRAEKLFAKGVISDSERDAAVAEHQTALARLHRYQAALALAREGTRAEEIAEAQAALDLRQAELALAEQRLEDATIRSPVTGFVVSKHVEEGEWTQVGATVVEVIDTSTLRVHTHVTEKVVRKVSPGQEVVLTLDALPGQRFRGIVHRVIPRADVTSRSFPVQIDVVEPRGVVRPGMFARVGFVLDERADVLQVPEDALVHRGDMVMVYKVVPPASSRGEGRGGPGGGMPPPAGPVMQASRAVVRAGARQGGMVEVREVVAGSLEAGDLVVVTGNENLRGETMTVAVIRGLPREAEGRAPSGGRGSE
ncbi:MAG: efflux RND transporter periplasmic adaptor subunit [Candidatus Brocadiia bacterium]